MIYLWVALGGALGSVARFWLSNLMAALTGAGFPWGTLLINVIGSFVISFFGTLTGKAARLTVPPEISIFVMVGICGGFTTFSSFSMQTLQLARAGEWERAGCYVLASVVICLLACWLGFIAALSIPAAIPARAVPPAAAQARAMPATLFERAAAPEAAADGAVLALLPSPESVPMLLNAAQELAAIMGCKLAALHVRVDPETTIIPSDEVLTEAQAAAITRSQQALQQGVEREVAAWMRAHPEARLSFLERFGAEKNEIAVNARHAAAAVVALPAPGDPADGATRAAIFDARCPVLLMPPGVVFKPSHIAIGWKNAGHARAAIAASMPLIAQASQISLIGIGDPARLKLDQARLLLGPHAARAQVINPPRDERKVGRQLLAEAESAGADTLIIGAYRHGRVAEWALGGVTESVLGSSGIPLFLKH